MSVPGAGTNKAVERLRSLRCLLHKSPGDRLSLLSNCHSFYLHFWNGNETLRREQTNSCDGGGGGLGRESVSV